MSVLDYLERQTTLTRSQYRIIAAAVLGDGLEFFDYYLIAFALSFIVGGWKLTFGQSAMILLSSGIGAMIGSLFYGYLADKIGRRSVFIATLLNTAIGTGMLAFTPQGSWIYIVIFRLVSGLGVGGLYIVDLPLVQEFVPGSKRGAISGVVTSAVPLGLVAASVLASTLTPYIGWRGLFAIGTIPALLALLVLVWVPESPRWLLQKGRFEEARRSLAWALEMNPADLPLPAPTGPTQVFSWTEIFRYPRSIVVSWISNLGAQTGTYGLKLWAPTLVMLILGVSPVRAAFLLIWVNLAGFFGRMVFAYFSDTLGRRLSAALSGFGAAILVVVAALAHSAYLGRVPVFWLMLIVCEIFVDGGWSIVGPYSAEVWPATIRTTGMGAAYAFGGLGKIIGPLGLALILGSSNVVSPAASVAAIVPAYSFMAFWFVLVAVVFLGFARETKGLTLEAIERDLETSSSTSPARREPISTAPSKGDPHA
jgi:MFS transporter, putative metabolite:H+ symporter